MDKFNWNGDKTMRAIRSASLEAFWLLGQQVLTDAAPDVPVETGTLLRSGRVSIGKLPPPGAVYAEAQAGISDDGNTPDFGQKEDTVYVSYSTPYALWLHESPDWHGRLKPRAHWKWIERAIPKSRRKFRAIVKRAFDKVEGI